jgi:hypothetical protein
MKTRTVIEDLELAAPPDRVMAQLTAARDSWRVKQQAVTFRFDLVGEHVVAKLRITRSAPELLVLECDSDSGDLGWAGTRITLALARTARGSRIALIHSAVSSSATRDVWAAFLAELAQRCAGASVAA